MNSRIDALRAKLGELSLDGMIVSVNADQNISRDLAVMPITIRLY